MPLPSGPPELTRRLLAFLGGAGIGGLASTLTHEGPGLPASRASEEAGCEVAKGGRAAPPRETLVADHCRDGQRVQAAGLSPQFSYAV
jgi:hypothetical protein